MWRFLYISASLASSRLIVISFGSKVFLLFNVKDKVRIAVFASEGNVTKGGHVEFFYEIGARTWADNRLQVIGDWLTYRTIWCSFERNQKRKQSECRMEIHHGGERILKLGINDKKIDTDGIKVHRKMSTLWVKRLIFKKISMLYLWKWIRTD